MRTGNIAVLVVICLGNHRFFSYAFREDLDAQRFSAHIVMMEAGRISFRVSYR